jgi:hypothetical protein
MRIKAIENASQLQYENQPGLKQDENQPDLGRISINSFSSRIQNNPFPSRISVTLFRISNQVLNGKNRKNDHL